MVYSDIQRPKSKNAVKEDSTRLVNSSVQSGAADNTNNPGQPTTENNLATRINRSSSTLSSSGLPADTIVVGSILKDRFIIENEIARGGMGVVYRARDIRKLQYQDRNPYIAIKVLGEECKARPDSFIALQREAGKAQKLAHPNIVTVYDFDSDGDTVFMTMEYLEGESLEHFFSQRGTSRLPIQEALAIIDAMGQGLAYAHQKGIVHCDFKPGNVFLTKDATVKILDFGIARAVKHPEQLPQDVTRFDVGSLGALTPAYASCEMIENDTPDPRDDIYALACVAYELLSGQHPFNKLPANIARDNHLKPAPIKGLNKPQWNALLHGLAFERKARLSTVQQFLAGLNSKQKLRGLSRGWRAAAMLGLIVLLSAMGAYTFQSILSAPKPQLVTATTVAEASHPVALTAEQQKTVERLLEAAEIHFMVQRVTEPEGSNAFEAYKHLLEIDPGNPQAIAGINKIADYYETQAQGSLREGDTQKTRLLIQTGLNVMPQHAGLLKLKQESEVQSIFSKLSAWFKRL
jgi:serine/threonine protein kinase